MYDSEDETDSVPSSINKVTKDDVEFQPMVESVNEIIDLDNGSAENDRGISAKSRWIVVGVDGRKLGLAIILFNIDLV